MSVRVPIQADAQEAVRAVNNFGAALRDASREGKNLSDIDLSKLGADSLAKDLQKAIENLRQLSQVGRGETGSAARRIFGKDPSIDTLFDLEERAAQHFPDPNARRRFIKNVSDYAMRGTSFDRRQPEPSPEDNPWPAPPGEPPAPPRDKGFKFGKSEQEGLMKSLVGGLVGGAGFFMAQMGLGSIAGVAGTALQAGGAENDANDQLLRRTGDLAEAFDTLRHGAEKYHEGLLLTTIDFTRLSSAFATAAGVGGGAAERATRLAAGMAEGYGQDPGSFVQGMGRASALGMDPKAFAELLGDTVARSGIGVGRVEEVMGALLQWTQSASRVSANGRDELASVSGFDDLFTKMQSSGSPALMGQNGLALLGQINSAVTNGGGGGPAGQALLYRAFMAAGQSNPYEIELQRQKGAFAVIPNSGGKTNFSAIMTELQREYGGLDKDGTRAALAASQFFGINANQALALNKLDPTGTKTGSLNDYLKGIGISNGLDGVQPTALGDIFTAKAATPAQLEAMRRGLLKNDSGMLHGGTLTAAEVASLSKDGQSPDQMRASIIGTLARHGMVATDATRAQEASNQLTDKLTEVGRILQNTMTPLKDAMGKLLDPVASIADSLASKMRPGMAIDPDDGVVKFADDSTPSQKFLHTMKGALSLNPLTMFGAMQDNAAQHTAIAPDITDSTGMLTRIGMQESGMGTASPKVFGETGGASGTFVEDLKGAALSDPKLAALIAGKSDAELAGLETLDHADIQRLTAAYHLKKVRAMTHGTSMMDQYAVWNFGSVGNDIMAEQNPDREIWDFLGSAERKSWPSSLRHETVGQWRQARSKLFPADDNDIARWGGNGGIIRGEATVTIKNEQGKVIGQTPVTMIPSGQPMPHGTGAQAQAG